MDKPILNTADAPRSTGQHGATFAYEMRELAGPLGAREIGANLTRVPPGHAALPFHHHYANEEHFFVVSGSGVLRVGAERHPVKAHDYMVHRPGGPELAHQLINTGTEDLVYLAISTMRVPEVVGYPDSGKTGVRAVPDKRFLVSGATVAASLGYWDGEDGRAVAAVLADKEGG